MSAIAPTLILGIGNILLRDEGVGVHAIEKMMDMELPPDVEILDGGTSGVDLVDPVANRDKLIVIDAMQAGARPGTVYRLSPGDLWRESASAISLHELGLLDTLAAAGHLGCAPGRVVIFGVQPGEVGAGLELSAEVTAALEDVIRLALEEATSSE
jgi:hydrogenase maturation protease